MGLNKAQAEEELDLVRGDLPTESAGRCRGGRGWICRAQEPSLPGTAPASRHGEMKQRSPSRGRDTTHSCAPLLLYLCSDIPPWDCCHRKPWEGGQLPKRSVGGGSSTAGQMKGSSWIQGQVQQHLTASSKYLQATASKKGGRELLNAVYGK